MECAGRQLILQSHVRQAKQQRKPWKGTAASRGYDGAWQRLRTANIHRQPLRIDCLKQENVRAADDVNHRVPFKELSDALGLLPNTLQSSCRPHHKREDSETLI
jgi:hypothetical protein